MVFVSAVDSRRHATWIHEVSQKITLHHDYGVLEHDYFLRLSSKIILIPLDIIFSSVASTLDFHDHKWFLANI